MTGPALVLVERDPGTDEGFAEALRMVIGLTLGVAEVRLVLDEEAATALEVGPVADDAVVQRHLATLEDLGVPVLVHGDGEPESHGGLPVCSPAELDAMVRESGTVVVW